MSSDGRLYGWTGSAWVPIKLDSSGNMVIDQAIGGGGAGFTDAFSLGITAADSNAVPTDVDTYLANLLQGDTNADPTDTAQLGFPAGNFDDPNVAPSDANALTMRIWLSGGTATANGVTNVANSNGANDAANAVIASAVAGVASPSITSALGANVPSGLILTSVIYRGWFRSVNPLSTSKGELIMHSLTAGFVDKIMFSNAALGVTVDHLTGTFTYDLLANGINTQALIQSCQMIHKTTDAAAGVQPHTMTVDAGCLEIVGAFV